MGSFDTYADSPFLIKTEGETISLAFKEGVPTVGQGTVSWNVPVPSADCNAAADGRTGAYSGIVVLLSTSPLTPQNIPTNGLVYVADPTANPDLHAGDKIGGALVIGAFYEASKKGAGQELTSEFVVTDLKSGTPYYVGAYAVDAQLRYHTDGVRAYSDKYAGESSSDQPSTQMVTLGEGVLPTDGTGLDPNVVYEFDILWDSSYPKRDCEKVYHIYVDGAEAGTYEDLVLELNTQFSKIENPPQSPVAPNTGVLYWDAASKKLYVFDGNQMVEKTNLLKETSDPSQVDADEYWYKPSTDVLYLASASPTTWSSVNKIDYGPVDPRAFKCTDHWFNNVDQAYIWGGSAWCEVPTVVGETDPAAATMLCGSYWYDTTNSILYSWNAVTCSWDTSGALVWPMAPNMLSDGTYWFDLATNKLFTYETSPLSWIEQTALVIGTVQPSAPAVNLFWYNATTEVLKQWNGTSWITIPVIVWEGDPANVVSCELWWRSTDDELFVWDTVNLAWVPVVSFVQSATDPQIPPTVPAGTIWYKPTAGTILRWDGGAWLEVEIIVSAADPTIFADGDAWYNPVGQDWYVWTSSPEMWNLIEPIDSEDDPTTIPNGTFWFNAATNLLYTRSGIAWISTPYVSAPPLPKKGERWFSLTTNTLYEWDGYKWVVALPLIYAELTTAQNCSTVPAGHLKFSTRDVGGGMNLQVLTPGTPGEIGTGFASFGYQELAGSTYRVSEPDFYTSVVPEELFLFTNLTPSATLGRHVYGADGLSSTPSYLEIGVGTDGTPDERRELADSLRQQLGHPTITVELTKQQMDKAIALALETYRLRSSAAYKRGFFFMNITPGQQEYVLTNKQLGYNKIVNIAAAHRFTSAFLSSAHGAGVYGQVVLQHLYNMGTYDLTSFHLVAQYVEQLEHLFATRLTFHWHESTRTLNLYNSFTYQERILLDCSVERTEQELLKDRMSKNWLRRWALAEAMMMLAQIRGKFGSLPGAGGGVTLNAAELSAQADALKQELIGEIDDYIAADPEDYGLHTTFIIG
jgi:hypothetical protein